MSGAPGDMSHCKDSYFSREMHKWGLGEAPSAWFSVKTANTEAKAANMHGSSAACWVSYLLFPMG